MKNLMIIGLIGVLTLSGCANYEWLTPSVDAATSAVLQYAVSPSDRVEKANMIYASAHALRTLSGGEVTPEAIKNILDIWLPNKAHWSSYASAISGLYAQEYAKVQGNPKEIAKLVEQFALGIENAAARVK